MQLTDRYTHAIDYARRAHTHQVRKGTDIPYLSHLLSVSALVIEFGGSEDQAIAGLLHDVIEDCGASHEAEVGARFGPVVARIVVACTDATAEGKAQFTNPEAKRADWIARKRAYLAHLAHMPADVLLVSACDKLHNARAIVQDLVTPGVGAEVFSRFTGGTEGTLAYYNALAVLFAAKGAAPSATLGAVVDEMHALAGVSERTPL